MFETPAYMNWQTYHFFARLSLFSDILNLETVNSILKTHSTQDQSNLMAFDHIIVR